MGVRRDRAGRKGHGAPREGGTERGTAIFPGRKAALGLLLALVGGVAATACGPSFHAIYEGSARFEHCYALEESPQSSMPERADCWREWSERYTYGQTRDRINYATARYVALSQAPNVPTDEALMMAAPGVTPRTANIAAPTPTNAFAPPPKVLDEDGGLPRRQPSDTNPRLGPASDGGSPAAAKVDTPPPASLPASLCAEQCGGAFRECGGCASPDANAKEAKVDDAGAPAAKTEKAAVRGAKGKSCSACEASYKTCMRACFK